MFFNRYYAYDQDTNQNIEFWEFRGVNLSNFNGPLTDLDQGIKDGMYDDLHEEGQINPAGTPPAGMKMIKFCQQFTNCLYFIYETGETDGRGQKVIKKVQKPLADFTTEETEEVGKALMSLSNEVQ